MTYWKRGDSIITVGGFDGSWRVSEVQQYSRMQNQWKTLPPLPEKMHNSSALVLGDALYNIGGHPFIESPIGLI